MVRIAADRQPRTDTGTGVEALTNAQCELELENDAMVATSSARAGSRRCTVPAGDRLRAGW